MESAFDHFAAEQPCKDRHASEEDAQPEIVELDDSRQDLGIAFHLRRARRLVSVEDDVCQDDERRYQCEQIDPNSAARKQIPANLVAHKDGDLASKEPPWLFLRPLLGPRD
jgi:hypothetical protein